MEKDRLYAGIDRATELPGDFFVAERAVGWNSYAVFLQEPAYAYVQFFGCAAGESDGIEQLVALEWRRSG